MALGSQVLDRLCGKLFRCCFPFPDSPPSEWVAQVNKRHLRWFFLLVSIGAGMHFLITLILSTLRPVHYEAVHVLTGLVLTAFGIFGLCLNLVNISPRLLEMGVFMAMLGITATAVQAPCFFKDVQMRTRALMLNLIVWKAWPIFIWCRLWQALTIIVWTFFNDVAAHMICLHWYDDPFNARVFAVMLMFCFLFTGAALRSQSLVRSLYHLQEILHVDRSSFEAMLTLLSDGLVWIGEDGDTVLKTDGRCEIFSDGNMMPVAKLHDIFREEGQHLRTAFERAMQVPSLVHTRFVSTANVAHDVDLFIVSLNQSSRCHASLSSHQRSFLVAVCQRGPADAGKFDVDCSSEPSNECSEMGMHQVVWPHDTRHDEATSETCSDVTTKTDKLFGGFNTVASAELKVGLQRLMELGRAEHWILEASDIQFDSGTVLGSGGFSVVTGGHLHGTSVAIKRPHASTPILQHEALKTLVNEIRILRRVRHPNLVIFHGACIRAEVGDLALIFECVRGTQLRRYINMLAVGTCNQERYRLAMDVCIALRYLHGQHPPIVHGDLKGPNIMVEAGPRAKLLDFGLSRLISRRANPLGGTISWMAPEVIIQPKCVPRTHSDVYSFGCLLGFIMSGKHPHESCSKKEIIRLAKQGLTKINLPSDACMFHECSSLQQECCAYAPNNRPDMVSIYQTLSNWSLTLCAVDHQQPSATTASTCRYTTVRSMMVGTLLLLQSWKAEDHQEKCCTLHANLVQLEACCAGLKKRKCADIQNSGLKQCSECGVFNDPGDTYCPMCNHS